MLPVQHYFGHQRNAGPTAIDRVGRPFGVLGDVGFIPRGDLRFRHGFVWFPEMAFDAECGFVSVPLEFFGV
jgi:hypothetical protein